ncbi:MAG: PEP/pyruvate-binding domain-containing protein [Acidimicrobiia bacterium]
MAVPTLRDPGATDPAVVGSKAANLAVAARHGMRVVPGFAVPVDVVAAHPVEPPPEVAEAWLRLGGPDHPVVVRSSAPGEDLATSSMAGVFDSVIDVRGWDAFADAYRAVVASGRGAPMAVLVQRHVRPELGGVLFGADPVTGRSDRAVVVAVAGGPHELVSGAVAGRRTVLDRTGRVRDVDGDPAPVLRRTDRRRLLALARRARACFGGPQDIEWAIDGGRLLLLQSRPITAMGRVATGPLLGPGPVAETFPRPLTALEQDLWVPPLREAMAHVLALTGAASRRRLRRSPVVTVVDGQVVADLQLLGADGARRSMLARLDPRPPVRRLSVAWRVGRLRGAVGALGRHVADKVDAALAAVPEPALLGDAELDRVLANVRAALRSVHGHEVLAGALLDDVGRTGAEAALDAIAAGRALGWSDEDLIARLPVALAVTVPSVGPRPPLPEVVRPDGTAGAPLALREELRLRARWLHELDRAVVREVGVRLAARQLLADPEDVAHLRLEQLRRALLDGTAPPRPVAPTAPVAVPARFRLADDGTVVAEAVPGGSTGVGAGGGRGTGPVAHADPALGDVLVVRTLDPDLAPLLPRLAGLVAETGSPLSHLAILAREHGVPVVVGDAGARDRLVPGTVVVVDGRTGDVEAVAVP